MMLALSSGIMQADKPSWKGPLLNRFYATLSTLLILTLSGCSHSGAFDVFKVDEEHERAIDNLRTSTIVQSFETKAIISAIYLNNTLPEQYGSDKYESFFIALYLQEDIRLFYKANLSAPEGNLTLNGDPHISVEELKKNDRLRTLMPIKNEWNRYYLIRFPHEDAERLDLTFESYPYGKAVLTYHKAEQ